MCLLVQKTPVGRVPAEIRDCTLAALGSRRLEVVISASPWAFCNNRGATKTVGIQLTDMGLQKQKATPEGVAFRVAGRGGHLQAGWCRG